MAFTEYRTWTPGETVTAALLNAQVRDNGNVLKTPLAALQRGATMKKSTGFIAADSAGIGQMPFSCTAVKIRAKRIGGGASASTVNVRKNGTTNLLATALSLAAADTWYSSTTLQNEDLSPDDWLEALLVTVAGSPTEISVFIDVDAVE